MKYILLLLSVTLAYGQGKTVVVYGQMTSDYKDAEIDKIVGIYVRYTTSDNSYLTFPDKINQNGYYTRTLEEAETVTIESNVHDFYAPAITEAVNGRDSIRIDLHLIPKPYVYTREKAMADTRIKKIQLVTFDSLEYECTKKIDLQKDFGFSYMYMPKPKDYDFETNIENYNRIVEFYLTLKDGDWETKLNQVRDSVVNLEADNYSRNHKIDIEILKVPKIEGLPKEMQERIGRLQQNYNDWLKEKLTDYSIAYTIKVITSDKSYDHFYLLPQRISMDYEVFLPELIKLLTNSTEAGMDDYPGVMLCRGLAPTGPVGCVAIPYSDDDLFTVAGRANHLLKRLTGEYFGWVSVHPTEADMKKLQNRWVYWLLQLQ